MPNAGDFDPAEAIRQQRAAEEAEKQRAQAQKDLRRANILELLRYADGQLENIRNPVVSEFVVTERWWTDQKEVLDKRAAGAFARSLRADQDITYGDISRRGFFNTYYKYRVATRHERQTRYYGSWLWLSGTSTSLLVM